MVSLQFGYFTEMQVQDGVKPIPQVEARVVNFDPYKKKEKGMVPYTTPKAELMWVSPDLLMDEQWISANSKKPTATRRSCNTISAVPDKGVETTLLSRKEVAEQAQANELRYSKALRKDTPESSKDYFRFDVLAQLANIPAKITLFELLRLSRLTREALHEALVDNEAFLTHFPSNPARTTLEEACP
ncbi:uncharacterized protein A4U43_C10F10350 [Asparagus officinalis]|uniref:Uncharacterized protein n=1 Tax=Asparagus officinalis TaxID=4686 RepID=A0A5P1E1V0_ASPOF|nr:uncharacterized protein A4U43_C10F10350 [Asparagus officinalis]